ncbi:MAG: hypothetical protein PXX77_00305 [Gallionella sp.]|nr:hypothetical protein [Gallionella sp.]
MATWNKEFNPSVITDRVEQTKKNDGSGKATFNGLDFEEHVSILTSMLQLHQEIPDDIRKRIIVQSLFASASSGQVTPTALLAEVTVQEKLYLSTPKKRFRLVSSISISLPQEPLTIRFKDSQICFGWKENKSTQVNRSKLISSGRDTIIGTVPMFYTTISALVSARSESEAATLALDHIDLIRGMWNLWKNRGLHTRISMGARSPVNAFILGPIHTLHTPTGALATEAWWYEPSYRGSVSIWREHSRVANMLKFAERARRALRCLPYRYTVESAIVRYTRALDSRDWNNSFLQLWSIIELLTGTTQNDSHKVTVRRAAFIFQDHEYASEALRHLRFYRNTAVHSGTETEQIEPLMYQAKNTVEALIEFHLSKSGMFSCIDEAASFLDSPLALADIEKNIRKLRAVRKYRHPVN